MPQRKHTIAVKLAAPRGFCAGVQRAVLIVEKALEHYGPPVYIRHEIVHNRHVVEALEAKGAVFIEELEEAPDDRPVIFSAHGVPKAVPESAHARNMIYIDATCPLVSKVHREVERHWAHGRHIILIGHEGHPEVIGTRGQLPEGAVTLVETLADVQALQFSNATPLAYASQTTLSVDDTAEIIRALQARYPHIHGPKADDICYATTNRQAAVKAIAPHVDIMVVIGGHNSSNSRRLKELAEAMNCHHAVLIEDARNLPWHHIDGAQTLGLTAGASAPEILVEQTLQALRARYEVKLEEVSIAQENITFKLPRQLPSG